MLWAPLPWCTRERRAAERRGSGALTTSSRHALVACSPRDTRRTVTHDSPLKLASQRALGGGLVGAGAMAANVVLLMWLRTTLFVQYARGMSFTAALRHIYASGGGGLPGLRRFYAGVSYGLLLAPVARFGDTASNAFVLSLFGSSEHRHERDAPMIVKASAAGVLAGTFRGLIMPLDTIKTMVQVEGGVRGRQMLRQKIAALGLRKALFAGGAGAGVAHAVAFVPWYTVHNLMQQRIPRVDVRRDGLAAYAGRSMAIGLVASAVSDSSSNALHVLKTIKQTSPGAMSYRQAAVLAIGNGGVLKGLFLRGLGTRLAASTANGMLFSLLWNLGNDTLSEKLA